MVKCSDCGFLAFRRRDTFEFVEAVDSIRGSRSIPNALVYPMPFCFARQLDFREKYGWDRDALGIGDTTIFPAITEERECDAFTQWQQGFGPKEHREMLDRKWRLEFEANEQEKERLWREEQRSLDIAWRTEQDSVGFQRHQEEMALLRSQHRGQLLVLGGLVTVIVVVSTIAGAMIEGGWIGKPW